MLKYFSCTQVHTPVLFDFLETPASLFLCLSRSFPIFLESFADLLTTLLMGDTFFVASFETISNASEFFDSVVVVDETKLVLASYF
jgi:hypothetical protein